MGLTTKVKQAPFSKSSPVVKQQRLQAMFQSFHSSKLEKTRQTIGSGARM
jgi:hypothetical protein